MKICVIGLGYVGMTLSLALAQEGEKVLGLDRDKDLVNNVNQGRTHLSEPGVLELLEKYLDENFHAFHRPEDCSSAKVHIICVNTPISQSGKPDMSPLIEATESVTGNLKTGDLVVIRSTVAPTTTRTELIPILEKSNLITGRDFSICVAPERTVEGKAIAELGKLPQIVGGYDRESSQKAIRIFSKITKRVRIVSSMEAAEMIKLIDNCYRYAMFAIANELSLACEDLGLDSHEIIESANWKYPRNSIKKPGAGVGGGCLPKDTRILIQTMEKAGRQPVIFKAAREVNEGMPRHIFQIIDEFHISHGLNKAESKVLVLGFAFKGRPEVNDTRNSPGGYLATALHEAGYHVYGYDPVVENDRIENFNARTCELQKGFQGATTMVTMNDNPKFSRLDLKSLSRKMSNPSMILDGWEVLDESKIRGDGIKFRRLGNGRIEN